ncbi:hypothetical protein NMG60_11024034 [Bertholletia excelsa]
MDDSGAILCQISSLKDMLDLVNEEIEASIQVTREMESEIVKCSEVENVLAAREKELTKYVYMLEYEISGLMAVTAESRTAVKLLEEELCCLTKRRNEILKRINQMREDLITSCQDFQWTIAKGQKELSGGLLSEKKLLENEFHFLGKKNNALRNSVSAFVEEILEDLNTSNSALHVELENGKIENKKLLKNIDELKTTLLSAISFQ